MTPRGELAERLEKGRKGLGLTQEAFGERMGEAMRVPPLSRGTIAAWELGDRVPFFQHLEVLGDLFGWSEQERAENALLAQRAPRERSVPPKKKKSSRRRRAA